MKNSVVFSMIIISSVKVLTYGLIIQPRYTGSRAQASVVASLTSQMRLFSQYKHELGTKSHNSHINSLMFDKQGRPVLNADYIKFLHQMETSEELHNTSKILVRNLVGPIKKLDPVDCNELKEYVEQIPMLVDSKLADFNSNFNVKILSQGKKKICNFLGEKFKSKDLINLVSDKDISETISYEQTKETFQFYMLRKEIQSKKSEVETEHDTIVCKFGVDAPEIVRSLYQEKISGRIDEEHVVAMENSIKKAYSQHYIEQTEESQHKFEEFKQHVKEVINFQKSEWKSKSFCISSILADTTLPVVVAAATWNLSNYMIFPLVGVGLTASSAMLSSYKLWKKYHMYKFAQDRIRESLEELIRLQNQNIKVLDCESTQRLEKLFKQVNDEELKKIKQQKLSTIDYIFSLLPGVKVKK